MHTTRILFTSLVALAAAGVSSAQSSSALIGTKSSVTLTVTANSTYGGFLVKNSVIDKQDDFENPPSVTYDVESLMNPLDYEPTGSDPANYYVSKTTEKTRRYGSGEDAFELTIEEVEEYVTKVKTLRYSNAQFIQALIDGELVDIPSPTGYSLVMIETAQTMDDDDDSAVLFFIERGTDIHYVGREASSAESSRDALVLSFSSQSSEAYNYRKRTVYKHVSGSDGVEQDTEGVTTYSDTFSGTELVYISLFPGYFDSVTETYVEPEGMTFSFTGHLNFNGRYDTKSEIYVLNSARVTSAPGGYRSSSMDDFSSYQSGSATISLSFAPSRVVPDITPYLDALPEDLAELKQEIINSYSDTSGEDEVMF